jgi:DNA-binding XRE family transcriptional regulator
MAKRIWDKISPIEKDAIKQGASLLGELRDKVDSGWRERSVDGREDLITGPRLREVRESRQISQEEMATRLGRSQSAVSQIEKRSDLLMSTLTQYIEAADGKLINLTVEFPEGTVQIVPFKD